jgi:homoserine kinase
MGRKTKDRPVAVQHTLITHGSSSGDDRAIIISHMIKIRVPATSANLGPGFDCMGLALDIWNEVTFEADVQTSYFVKGEGADALNSRPVNLLTNSAARLYEVCGKPLDGLRITADNAIPFSSGLGSSAAAIVAGLYGANEVLGRLLDTEALLRLAAKIEGHPDNVAPALLGGLIVSASSEEHIITRRYEMPELTAVLAIPAVEWPTHVARGVLPSVVSRADAIFNISRAVLVVDALQHGDLNLLQKVMDDQIHQSYRLARIPAGEEAYQTARALGASALSGAGPALITFVEPGRGQSAQTIICSVFERAGIACRGLILHTSNLGVQLIL